MWRRPVSWLLQFVLVAALVLLAVTEVNPGVRGESLGARALLGVMEFLVAFEVVLLIQVVLTPHTWFVQRVCRLLGDDLSAARPLI